MSGPAGGIIAARRLRERASGDDATPPRLITFDMGGTSTDVALVREGDERKFETEIDGVWVRAPMMDIHTVAAGGGSICSFDGQALTVGPHSAGANPGPLCYGKPHAQEITLTDINVALGLLPDDHFPFPLDRSRAELALRDLASKVSASRGEPTSSERLALGFREVASTRMAEAIRQVTVARGQDARNCELLVFGGAGGQHACAVARALGVNRIRCHVLSGVLSAFGIGLADESWTGDVDGGGALLDAPGVQSIGERLQVLADQGRKTLHRDSQSSREPTVHLSVELRYCGTNSSIVVPFHDVPEMIRCFERSHQEQFGFLRPGTAIEIFAGRVDCLLGGRRLTPKPTVDPATGGAPESTRRVDVLLDRGGWQPVPVFQLEEIRGGRLSGPALILSPTGSMVVEADFDARLVEDELVLERRPDAPSTPQREDESTPDVALLEVMAARFSSIAEQMGQALRRSASSTNIRDRLDFSCAMFDSAGRLVANAPHIPVHLGAMSESVAATIRRHPHPHPGDVFVTNDPALGGSHLPDITVITPVFDELGGLNFFVASRGHHADVGGKAPGSMPADSRHINEEGVVFSAELMVSDRQFREAFLRTRLASGPYPARRPEENLGDLRAQAAANQLGQRLLGELCDEYGIDIVKAYMAHLHERARRQVRAAISRLPNGTMQFSDCLDDGARIEVRMTKRDGKLVIDFDGTSPQVPTNFNAPRAVTVAAVLYFLRSLLSESLPLNEGCLDPIELNIPAGSLLCPSADRAVAAGNVETSQRIVDVLLGAAGVAAASQGTMNNLSFGNDGFGYYETIAGGAGATADCRGADGVQTHMTNTRITDVEVLESRFPVRVMEFSLRRGSGGAGAQRGGDGVVRELELLAPLSVEVLSSRRACPPFGLAGGSPGQPGRNFVDGKLLPGCFGRALSAGARLRLETPGGGGYGDRSNANEKK